MGKRKWRRIAPVDLASQEEQLRILNLIDQANELQDHEIKNWRWEAERPGGDHG